MPRQTLLRGIGMGLSAAAPVGPIGVICIRGTLADGRAAGLIWINRISRVVITTFGALSLLSLLN